MVGASDAEPSVKIHVTGIEPRPVKRRSAKRNSKERPRKRPKLASEAESIQKGDSAKIANGVHREMAPDVSFRHLFSFANASQTENQIENGASEVHGKSSFSFLEPRGNSDQEMESEVPQDLHTPGSHVDGDYPKAYPDESGINITAAMESGDKGPDLYEQAYREPRDGPPVRRKFPNAKNGGNGSYAPSTNWQPPIDTLVIPADVTSRPDQILQLANMFCRQKTMEQMEEDWCSPGGVRETMRRDFKQKRQNVNRARKLGTSAKR